MAVPDDPVDGLFAVGRSEFTAARDAVARALKRAGQADAAAAVKALRKPSAAVWALNQVAREDADTVAAFLDAVERVRAAQEAGADPHELRAAIEAHRTALRRVLDAVRSVADLTNVDPVLAEAGQILDAAAFDADVAAQLRVGRLGGTVVARSAFDALTPRPTPARAPASAESPTARPALSLVSSVEPASAPSAAQQRRAAVRLEAARAAAARARAKADLARAASDETNAALVDAERRLERARRDADRADAALAAALDALEQATAAVTDLE